MSLERKEKIRQNLENALQPSVLEITDDSAAHAGHIGAREGRGHFRIFLVAKAFTGQSLLTRHRMVFEALGALMQSDIHALALTALSPEETSAK